MSSCYSFIVQFFGIILCILTYVILFTHIYGFFTVIAFILKKRLGVFFGLTWISIGLSLVYNIVFNHFWAMVIKPGGPRDLICNEALRKEIKNTESRKAAKVGLNEKGEAIKQEEEDDRFEGL